MFCSIHSLLDPVGSKYSTHIVDASLCLFTYPSLNINQKIGLGQAFSFLLPLTWGTPRWVITRRKEKIAISYSPGFTKSSLLQTRVEGCEIKG